MFGQVETHTMNVHNANMDFDDRPEPAIRLEKARKARGFDNAAEACRFFGWNYVSYTQHETGIRGLSRVAEKYAKAFRVGAGWLLSGEGQGPGEEPPPPKSIPVPLLAMVSAGLLMNDISQDDRLDTHYAANLPDGDWIALKVEGSSMDRISPPESIILVNRADKELVPNACYVIADEDGNATYKRYRPDPPRFEPVSTLEHSTIFPSHEPVIVGRVRRSVIDM